MGKTILTVLIFGVSLIPCTTFAETSYKDLIQSLTGKGKPLKIEPYDLVTKGSLPQPKDARKTDIKIEDNLNLKFNVNPFNSFDRFQTIQPSLEPEYEVGLTFNYPF